MTNGLCEHAEHCDFFASTSRNKNLLCELASKAKIGEHEQASTRLNFASKSSKGKISEQLRILMDHSSPLILTLKFNQGTKFGTNLID